MRRKAKKERTEARIIVLLTADEKRQVTKLVKRLRRNGARTSSAAFARKAIIAKVRQVRSLDRIRLVAEGGRR